MNRQSKSTSEKIGWIPFWNLHPLKTELHNLGLRDLDMESGVPTEVNRLLASGKVSVAPCSSVCLALNTDLNLALPLGVACEDTVDSVYLGSRVESTQLHQLIRERHRKASQLLEDLLESGFDIRTKAQKFLEISNSELSAPEVLPAIRLSRASATSVMLCRVLYRLWFGQNAYEAACRLGYISENPPVTDERFTLDLVIGDEALARRGEFHKIYDLGSIWADLTGLPFVYACWQSSRKVPSSVSQILMKAAERAEAKMKVQPKAYLPDMPLLDDKGRVINLEDYWSKIYYRLGLREYKSLTFFLSLVKTIHPIKNSEAITVRILHFQEIVNSFR